MRGSGSGLAAPEQTSTEEFRDTVRRENLHSVFQPIVDLSRRQIYGYEGLIRGPAGGRLEDPGSLFECARRIGKESEFEILCRKISIQTFAALDLPAKLFLNISPSALVNPGFKRGRTLEYLARYGVNPNRVVIEVTENQQTQDFASLKAALNYYRNMGFKVALDDLGAGYSSLRLWSEVLPDYIKVDKHFIRNIHRSPVKTRFIAGLVEMAGASECRLIAEGVECREEYETLLRHGLAMAQGYYFARPRRRPVRAIDTHLFAEEQPGPFQADMANGESVAKICRLIEPEQPGTLVKNILELFQARSDLQILPIVEQGKALGLIERHQFFNLLMETPYGLELYGKYPIGRFVEHEVMRVDVDDNLESVSRHITSLASSDRAFIVTRQGKYHGVATILDLLGEITELKIRHATHANPLTLLPGIVPTNQAMDRLLAQGTAFSTAYFDLDNFKPYNDYYGYEAGDSVIKLLAELLSEAYAGERALTGHIGGDDFIVVDTSDDYLARVRGVLDAFAERIGAYYSPQHLRDGGISSQDRRGQEMFFPLLSISVGIVTPEDVAACRSHIDISDLVSEAKKRAKQTEGNCCFINRRKPAQG